MKALWRDSRTVMETADPIRPGYSMCPVTLETSSGRKSAMNIGKAYNAGAVLLLTGKVDYEKGSLAASKAGMHLIGTAARLRAGMEGQ